MSEYNMYLNSGDGVTVTIHEHMQELGFEQRDTELVGIL